jgi:hypothetical protein
LVLGAAEGAGIVPAMPRRDEPPLSPEQALALASDVLDDNISQAQVLAIIKALRVSARLCCRRQPIAAANNHLLAVAFLVEFKRRAKRQRSEVRRTKKGAGNGERPLPKLRKGKIVGKRTC